MRGVVLDALAGEDAEEVPALGLGHEGAIAVSAAGRGRVSLRLPAVATGGLGGGRWSTRSEVRAPVGKPVAVQLLEGDDADVDGIPEGAGLRAGLGHADQVRGDEGRDVVGVGVADPGEPTLRRLDERPCDRGAAVLIGGDLDELGRDPPESFFVGFREQPGIRDHLLRADDAAGLVLDLDRFDEFGLVHQKPPFPWWEKCLGDEKERVEKSVSTLHGTEDSETAVRGLTSRSYVGLWTTTNNQSSTT